MRTGVFAWCGDHVYLPPQNDQGANGRSVGKAHQIKGPTGSLPELTPACLTVNMANPLERGEIGNNRQHPDYRQQ